MKYPHNSNLVTGPTNIINLIYRYVDDPKISITRKIEINADTESIFHFIERIGGDNGWYTFNWMIKLRRLFSSRRKSYIRENKILTVGEKVNPFEVVDIEKDSYLVLKFVSNMLDGVFGFYLDFVESANKTTLYAFTCFDIKNIRGKLYWILIKPFDTILQKRMLANIKTLAEKLNT